MISNKSKKEHVNPHQGVSKKVKNLRYFLRKKRNITYKHAPSSIFSRGALNTTYFDADKQVVWTVELIFMAASKIGEGFSPFRESEQVAQVVLNNEEMVNEETTMGSVVSKGRLG